MKKIVAVFAAVLFSAVLSACSKSTTPLVALPPGSNVGTLITSPSTTPVTIFMQTLASTDGEVAPGQANYWDIDADFSLQDGSDDQFDNALQVTVGAAPFDLIETQDRLTFYTPVMGAADGVKTASVSDGTGQWYSSLTGTYSAYLHPTSDSRLQQTLLLTSATGTVTLSWNENANAYSANIPGGPSNFRVVVRNTSGEELSELYRIDDTSGTGPQTADLTPYRGQTVVLSFEMAATWDPTVIDDVSVVDDAATQFVTNGDFEDIGSDPAHPVLTGWNTNTPAEVQNITSGVQSLEGLDVTRSFYTVPNKLWGRWVDVYSNPTDTVITKTVTYYSNLGSDSCGIIYSTPTATTKGLTSWDGSASDRDLGMVFGNATTIDFLSASDLGACDGTDDIYVTYDISVPAGGKVSIVNFIILDGTDTGQTAGDGTALASDIDSAAAEIISGFRSDPQYTRGMTQEQIDSILNF